MGGSASIKHIRDSTKREYPVNSIEELKIVRAKYNEKDKDGKSIRPYFFAHVARKKGYYDSKHKYYKKHMAPMDYLQEIVGRRSNSGPSSDKICYTIGDLIKETTLGDSSRRGYVDLILSMIREMDYNSRMLYQVKSDVVADKERKRELANEYYRKCIDGIRNLKLSSATIRDLLIEIDNPANSNIRRKLWSIVFGSLGDDLSRFFKEIKKPVYTLEECKIGNDGDVYIYGIPFKKKFVS